MLSSFEGDLELLEQGQLWNQSSAASAWTHRWCALSKGVIRVYTDRTAAIAQPEASLRSIPLETFSHLRTVGPSSEGAWELVLSSSATAASAAKRPQRTLPRSATSASLSQAFERSAPMDRHLAAEPLEESARRFSWSRNQSKKSATLTSAQQQGFSEALDVSEDKPRSLTLNKLSLRSKRLYRLLSGNGNSSSSLSELAGTLQSGSRPSSRAGSVRSSLAAGVAEVSAEDTVYLRARHATARTQWSNAILACHAALHSSHDMQPSLPRTSSTHFRPAIPSFDVAPASHITSSQSTSRLMRAAADLQLHFRRRREDHTRNAPSAASAMTHPSMANERRHASADYSPLESTHVERMQTIERPQTSGAGSLRSSLSIRRPSTSTGTSRPSTSSGRQLSETTAASSPPSSFSAMRLGRARSERRSNNSSPQLSKAALFEEACAAGRPGSSDTRIASPLDVRVDAASRGTSIDALRPPSNASNDGRESRFSMLRKASASSMSQPEFNGACLGLGLDLGRDPTLDGSTSRLRNASLAKREYPPPAPSNSFKQHRKQKSVSASDIYGSGRIAVAASASAEFLAPEPIPRAMSRSPSLFNLSAKLVSATTGNSRNARSSNSTDSGVFRSVKSKSPLNAHSALPAAGDSSFGSDSAYEFVPTRSEGHASIPVISLDGCEVASRAISPRFSASTRDRGSSRPGHKNPVRLTTGARRITSPLSSPQPLLDTTSSSHSEASSGSPVTPVSPLWPPANAGAMEVLSLNSSNSSGATISAVDHGGTSGAIRTTSRGSFTTVTMQRILPPTELIATLDRMRATEDASPTEHAASSEHSHKTRARPRSASAGALSSLVSLAQPKARRNEGHSFDEPIVSAASRRTHAPPSSTQQSSSYEHSLPAPPRTVKRINPSPVPGQQRPRVLEPLQTRAAADSSACEARQTSADFKVRLRRPTTPEYGSRLRGNSISTLCRSRPSPANSPSASPRRALL